MAEDAYCTLVMSDSYLPGAAVLAHSLRDAGTKKKLAALVTLDTLSADTISELKELYDVLIPVERIGNPTPANLYLMDRGDLTYTFSKIALWRQLQFRKIVYIDADVVALRAPDELFEIQAPFAASPDVGWPDAFNSGVMVISPNMGDYWALQTLASSGDSFDGADQGLLNQYYEHKDWHRLSFTYNCTPNAQYQWEPAYRYYKSNISMVHFIGRNKPWVRDSRYGGGAGVYNELLAKWWAVYDKHLKAKAQQYDPGQVIQAPNTIQRQVQGEATRVVHGTGAEHATAPSSTEPAKPVEDTARGITQPAPVVQDRKFSAPQMEWDATRSAPPAESRPEAANFPTETYTFSESKELFHAPAAYPEPPKDMWYEVPKTKPQMAEEPKPIFPWEHDRPKRKPTRVFAEDLPPPQPEHTPVAAAPVEQEEPLSRATTETPPPPEDPWQSFGQSTNAWDTVPGIDRYVRAVLGAQTKKSKPAALSLVGLTPTEVLSPTSQTSQERRESLILTDFPSAVERPSLPVTPAPMRRPTFWGEERDEAGQLPAAEGVPDQADWNPQEKLEQLRRTSLLEFEHLKKASESEAAKTAPLRDLPEHSYPRQRRRSHEAIHHNLPRSGSSSPQGHHHHHHHHEKKHAAPAVAASAESASTTDPHTQTQTGTQTETQTAPSTATEAAEATGTATAEGKPLFSEPDFGGAGAAATGGLDEERVAVVAAAAAERAEEEVLSPTER